MPRILVIDDDPLYREMVEESLREAGFETVTADDGEVGVARARSHRPDLVISDVVMEKMDGYQVLKALRSDPSTSGIPFVMITGWSSKGGHRQGMAMGADDYLPKPFNATELLATVRAQLGKTQAASSRRRADRHALLTGLGSLFPREIEQPLQAIEGLADVLRRGNPPLHSGGAERLGALVGLEAERLRRHLENLSLYLELEILEQDQAFSTELRKAETAGLEELVSERSRLVADRWARVGDLALTLGAGTVRMGCDYLLKVLDEVLRNAFEYSPPGSPVKVHTAFSRDRFGLSVSDGGKGMRPEELARSGAFRQHDVEAFGQGGLGLGLALVKQIVHLHGGVFQLKSAEGKGTRAFVEIPR